jgi:hypothetical protein
MSAPGLRYCLTSIVAKSKSYIGVPSFRAGLASKPIVMQWQIHFDVKSWKG